MVVNGTIMSLMCNICFCFLLAVFGGTGVADGRKCFADETVSAPKKPAKGKRVTDSATGPQLAWESQANVLRQASQKEATESRTKLKRELSKWSSKLRDTETDHSEIQYRLAVIHDSLGEQTESEELYRKLIAQTDTDGTADVWQSSARWRLFDCILYRTLDVDTAEEVLPEWSTLAKMPTDVSPTAPFTEELSGQTEKGFLVNARLRHMLVEYLRRPILAPVNTARHSQPLADSTGYWSAVASSARPHAEATASFEGDPKGTVLTRLVELHISCKDYTSALRLIDRTLKSLKLLDPSNNRALRSWLYFRRGYCIYASHMAGRPPREALSVAVDDYRKSHDFDSTAWWSPEALFLAGNLKWNCFQDLSGARKLWDELIHKHRSTEQAETAAYSIGVIFQATGDNGSALTAFKDFRTRFPKSHLLAGLTEAGLDRRFPEGQ
jgi:tetratricopeptide (TPR) repeat protein